MPLKLHFMKYSERKVSQYILALRTPSLSWLWPSNKNTCQKSYGSVHYSLTDIQKYIQYDVKRLASLFKTADTKEQERKNYKKSYCTAFYVTCKHSKMLYNDFFCVWFAWWYWNSLTKRYWFETSIHTGTIFNERVECHFLTLFWQSMN